MCTTMQPYVGLPSSPTEAAASSDLLSARIAGCIPMVLCVCCGWPDKMWVIVGGLTLFYLFDLCICCGWPNILLDPCWMALLVSRYLSNAASFAVFCVVPM